MVTSRIGSMSWGTYIMDLLLLLTAYGNSIDPNSDAAQFDYNGNGIIDNSDFLHLLSLQPPIADFLTVENSMINERR